MTPPRPRRTAAPQVAYHSSGARAGAYARWTVRARWWIVGTWVVGLVLLFLVGSRVSSAGDGLASIIPLDSPAIQAELRSVQEFGYPLSSRTVVVQRDAAGLSPFVQAESVLDAVASDQTPQQPPLLGALPLSNSVPISGFTAERGTTVLTYLFMDPRSSFSRQQRAAQAYIDEKLDRPDDAVVGVAGSVPARAEQARIVAEKLPVLELLTVAAIVLLVGLNFMSVVAPLLALAASAVAFVCTVELAHVLGGLVGIAAPAELEPLLVALLLGVVTDYTIFYLSALQTRGAQGGSWPDAVEAAVASYTPIVVAAGLTVAAGTASLLAASSDFFKGFGPAMALAILVGLAVSVTLVPALLAILGPAVFWPSPPRPAGESRLSGLRPVRRVRHAVQRLELMRHLTRRGVAAVVLAGCLVALALSSLPLRNIDLGVGFTTSLPSDNSVSRAAAAASAGFSPGISSPTTLLIEAPGVTSRVSQLSDLQLAVAELPGVSGVLGPAQNITQRTLGVVLSNSGNAARMLVVFDHDPLGAAAINDLTTLRERLPAMQAATGLGDVTISIVGDTALAQGLVGSTGRDLVRIAIAAVIVNLLLLVIFLRALVAPLYLLASSILALTASLGATVGIFLGFAHHDGLTFYVPFAAAVLLVALGSDYNIFGVGHVWEEAGHRPLREAIMVAVPQSTRAITAAGITLAVSFGMLVVIPLSPFRELGFAMALGILIDVLVVRSLMVPALLTLVGQASGWPGPHLRGSSRPRPTKVDQDDEPVVVAEPA